MNELFSKFSLQNFLRQFFCGVVFFTPLYLFAPGCMQNFFSKCGIAMGDSIYYVGALACVVGTIIYHLEKNLYSYTAQGIYECMFKKCKETSRDKQLGNGLLSYVIMAFVLILSIWLNPRLFLDIIWIFLLVVLAAILILKYFLDKKTFDTTLMCWKIEGSIPDDNETTKEGVRELNSIAAKVAVWSDFIHCTQSCCFAWLLGTYLTYRVLKPCSAANAELMSKSIAVAVVLLIIETVLIDRHRYAFVELMREKYNRLRSGRIEFSVKIRTMREGEGREEGGRDVGEFHCVVERL